MRFHWIDAGRLFFAFLVVVVHVPFVGRGRMLPVTCLAVPFFYVTTGFFAWSGDERKFAGKLRKSLKNYASLWILYFSAISGICWALKLFFGNGFDFGLGQFVDLFWTFGNCDLVDAVDINGRRFGISALWFLYGGALSIGILHVCRRHLCKTWFKVLVAFVWLAYPVASTEGPTVFMPRTIGASLPYLHAGIMLRRRMDTAGLSMGKGLFALPVLLGLLYAEDFLFHPEGYARVMLLPASIAVFCVLAQLKGGGFIQTIPVRTSLDIYVWHRFLYIVSAGILCADLHGMDSLVVYSAIFAVSVPARSLLRKKREPGAARRKAR